MKQLTRSSAPATIGRSTGSLVCVVPGGISQRASPCWRTGTLDALSRTDTPSKTSGVRPNSLLSTSRTALPPRRNRIACRTVCPAKTRARGRNAAVSAGSARAARWAVVHSSAMGLAHHQRILREAGVIRERIRRAERILSVRRDDLDACFPGLLGAILATSDALVGAPAPMPLEGSVAEPY